MKPNALFTFLLDYRNGTYVTQLVASDLASATAAWVDSVDLGSVHGLSEKGRPQLRKAFLSSQPSEVANVVDVWCMSARLSGHLALVHVVRGRDHEQQTSTLEPKIG